MTPGPGWYPDPIGDFRERWWDGVAWTAHVMTGRYRTESPAAPTEIPETEAPVWADGRHSLTTHAAYVNEGRGPDQVPWWAVAEIDVRIGAGNALAGTGDVVLIIDYPGYTDRRERRMKGVVDPDAVGALCLTWSRRHRRAAGYL